MPWTTTEYDPTDFANRRHIGPSPAEMAEMLTVVGAEDLDTLMDETLPADIRQAAPLDWAPMSEAELLAHMAEIASKNKVMTSMIGQGYYGTHTPPAIQRNVLENPAWYTAYTPYQPEISQGRLEALLNFQTMVADLTGLEIANASLLDEATAAAEAMVMAQRVAKSKARGFFVDENCHPQTIAVIETRAAPLGIEVHVGPHAGLDPSTVFGALFQYPGTDGRLIDRAALTAQIEALHLNKALAIVATDLLALTLIREPGDLGADIAIGSAQRFGVPLGYGGPHAAFMACREAYKRALPGRLVGVSVDSHGHPAYRLSLQTREQHIRREKATSNVCTAQALLAVMASFYAVFHGPKGLRAIAERVHLNAVRLAASLEAGGYAPDSQTFFDTITVHVGPKQSRILAAAVARGINLRDVGEDRIGISVDETTTEDHLLAVARAFGVLLLGPQSLPAIPEDMQRRSEYLTHPIFHMNRAESEMMRYMRRLSDRDLALDRAMIPLGSCTMKLNAAVEMMPVTWPAFGALHPFAPADQAEGYAEMLEDLSARLCEVTGYDAMSLQPNSGAQGEYAGLLTIAAFHRANGDDQRNICLIPVSAHGTNPASAQMAGMQVVVVKAAENGDVDLEDFRAKAEEAGDRLAAAMITYPSTHGVFETTLRAVCEITHAHGGQVYLDGANLNAMVGLSKPGEIGADVSHLNLHKTFCIPHGGGGPGMGPIGVRAHLAPHLPGHPETGGRAGPVSAAPFGSASILPISYAYLRLMGGEGMAQATKVAILNANYLAARLDGAFPVLYRGKQGRVAHECILDTRPFAEHDITVDDIAKRLMDCGFHAPTMSWPVAGTLMIEPTESETKAELDRFCDAMLAIRAEIADVAEGRSDPVNNPLKNAPHTMEDLTRDWDRPYSRQQACFPPGAFRVDKYWPPVNRIDNAHGDRHLVCTCPPLEAYQEAAE